MGSTTGALPITGPRCQGAVEYCAGFDLDALKLETRGFMVTALCFPGAVPFGGASATTPCVTAKVENEARLKIWRFTTC